MAKKVQNSGSSASSSILNRYIFFEILSPFLVSIFIFTGILFLARALRMLELVISKNVPLLDIILLFSFIVPRFLEIAIPMSLLIATLVAFGRLSADSELIVMRSCGISLKKLTRPVLAVAVLAFIATMALSVFIRPWADHKLGTGLFEIAKRRTTSNLISGVFNEFGPLIIYAEKINQDNGKLDKVIISDQRNSDAPSNFIAKNGQLISDAEKRSMSLQLYDGSIHQGGGLNYNVTHFDINNINLDIDDLQGDDSERDGKKTSEMFLPELNQTIRSFGDKVDVLDKNERNDLARALVELHKRFVLPVSCLCVAIIAMALGIQPSRGDNSWSSIVNVVMGILVIIGYYFLLALVSALSRNNVEITWLLMWMPNIILGTIAFLLFKMMHSERWLNITQAFGHYIEVVAKKLNKSEKRD